MNHTSINTSDIFGIYICVCCGSIIYGLTLTRASMVIPGIAIDRLPQHFWRFEVHLKWFIGGLSVYWCGIRRIILVDTW